LLSGCSRSRRRQCTPGEKGREEGEGGEGAPSSPVLYLPFLPCLPFGPVVRPWRSWRGFPLRTMHTGKVIQHIADWLRGYCEGAGQRGFVIGVSGGIDSAVTSVLCARTGLPTLCVEMPIHQA